MPAQLQDPHDGAYGNERLALIAMHLLPRANSIVKAANDHLVPLGKVVGPTPLEFHGREVLWSSTQELAVCTDSQLTH
jgi:hypothetical protein